ncbi:MAG: hypothetical protein GDA46_05010 [Bdellovibrionales bacterium]|nr:hypothetical protein [Bdellovibrionales bacterium]
MKKIILFFYISLFVFSLSSCNFLRGGEDESEDVLGEEDYSDEESDEFLVEDGSLTGVDTESEGEDFSYTDEEDFFEEEDRDETDENKGLFSWLFSSSKKSEDEEDVMDDIDSDDTSEEDFFQSNETQDLSTNESDQTYLSSDASSVSPEVSSNVSSEISSDASTKTSSDASTKTSSDVSTKTSSDVSTKTSNQVNQKKSLNKILKYPYKKEGFLVNAVYIARENEDLKSISKKIYKQDKTSELLVINAHLKNRSLVVGDKIYYNSPNRPNDNKRLLFYYEDINISPSYHQISSGENIRDVAYKLLGHPNSWKEIWATNLELESKGEIADSFTISYWTEDENVATVSDYNKRTQELKPQTEEEKKEEKNERDFWEEEEKTTFLEESTEKDNNEKDLPNDQKNKRAFLLKIFTNKVILGAIIFIILMGLIFRLILKKKKQRDFDYTTV